MYNKKKEYIKNSVSVPTNGPVCSDKKLQIFTNGLYSPRLVLMKLRK